MNLLVIPTSSKYLTIVLIARIRAEFITSCQVNQDLLYNLIDSACHLVMSLRIALLTSDPTYKDISCE